jgi:Cu+-exporting ATPase
LWPDLALWINKAGLEVSRSSREFYGFRYALIAAVLGGARTLFGSIERLFEGKIGADLAMAIACIAAILIGEPLVAAEVVVIGLVGECLESFTFSRTQSAIRKLGELFPIRCWVMRDGQEIRTLVQELRAGDVVVVKPGAKVPADGVIRDGRSSVDVSALTGESMPIDKGPGDPILAGSINQYGALTFEVSRTAEQTIAGQVLKATARALKEKAPVERVADRYARYFLPIVLALAVATFLANLAWYAGPFRSTGRLPIGLAARQSVFPTLAVLVVSCPCALILATPAAVIAALGRLAGTGVLLKSGAALERLAGVTAFAFDKTGTLTEGRLVLGSVIPMVDGISESELLRIAATAEQRSEHPLAKLILDESRRRQGSLDPIDEFQAFPGGGVTARSAGATILVGTPRFAAEQGIRVEGTLEERLLELDATGQTVLLVARDGQLVGLIGARDRVRTEARSVVADLRANRIQSVALLSGDRIAAVRSVANELEITAFHGELLPTQKADVIASEPHATAFVGDGINDAPALARAAVGIAVGSGAEIAAEAGDIVLMSDPLRPLPLLLRLSRETVRIVRQNIYVFAFGANLVGIAITGWLWPLLAPSQDWFERAPLAGVIYHQLSSLLVLLNSMRLLAFERSGPKRVAVKVRPTLEKIDWYIDRATDLDSVLHEMGHHIKPIAFSIALLVAAAMALSGFTQVGPDEVAVVRRFGRPRDRDLTPGLHYRWPNPVETVTKIQPSKVRVVEMGFRVPSAVPVATKRSTQSWMSRHESEGIMRVPGESVMPTGDGNLVEMLATLHFRVVDPRLYLLAVSDPDEILRANLETALRESVAAEPFLDLLTVNRDRVQREAFARLNKRLSVFGERGLGVKLEGLALRDLHPPADVVPDFHRVAQSAEERDRKLKDAEAEAIRLKRRAETDAKETENAAAVDAARVVRAAETDRDSFLAWHRIRTRLAPSEESQLRSEVARELKPGSSASEFEALFERRRRERIALNAALVDFRLSWMTMAMALGQRDKVFVDADKVSGRRHLLLFSPDQVAPSIVLPRIPGRGDTRRDPDEP